MSVDRQSEEQEWADNPRLNAWLAKQEAAFPGWAQQSGHAWDFTPGSLDQLEDLLRRQFSTWEEVSAAQEDPIVAVSAWYLGEVQNRHYGTVWHCNPQLPVNHPDQDGTPFVLMPEDPRDEYEEDDDERYRPGNNPFVEIRALFVRGPENRLRDVLNRYR
ncbi:hypothetical protein ACIP95_05715 [Micromonospora parva]|uniref:hypothetical protein n=1 Tax=Micromonospora parva TaxID=1464048 RepID=UPI00382356AD